MSVNLSNTEWSVMEEVWNDSPKTLMELVRAMEIKLGWMKSTTCTVVRRLEDKGALRHEQGIRARLYYPRIERGEAAAAETESLLSRVYGGSVGLMVASMAGQNALSQEDIDELRRIVREAEEAGK